MAQVVWTPQALDDLDAVCLFIARDSPGYAAIMARRAFEAVDRLERLPRSARRVPELDRDDIREVLLGNYRIIYRLESDQVQILTVHHGARILGPEHLGLEDE